MRFPVQVGLFGAGIFACASFFCLSENRCWSQSNVTWDVVVPTSTEEFWKSQELLLLPQQLREQNQQLLLAVELIRQETEGRLQRHASAIDLKLDRLSQVFASERERELDALHSFNRFALTTATGVAGILFLEILFLAWICARAVSRLTTRISVWLSAQSSVSSTRVVLEANEADLLIGNMIDETNLRLQDSIERLGRRLVELEQTAGRFHAAVNKSPALQAPKSSRPPSPPLTTKVKKPPGVSLTLSDGESLIFLPHDKEVTHFGTYRNILQKFRKTFQLARAGKIH